MADEALEVPTVAPTDENAEATGASKMDIMDALNLPANDANKPEEAPDNPTEDKPDANSGNTNDLENPVEDKLTEPEDGDGEIDIDDLISGSDDDTSDGNVIEDANLDDVDTSKWEPKDAEAFQKMRTQLKEAREQAKAGVTDEEKQELETLREKVYSADLTQSPEFQRKYMQPMQSKVQQIRDMGKEFGLTEDVLQKAANLGFKDRKTLLLEEVPDIQAELSIMFGELDGLNKSRQAAVNDAKTSLNHLRESAQAEGEEAFQESLKALKEAKMIPLLESQSKRWNNKVNARIESAKEMMAQNDPKVMADMALKASMVDEYQALVLRLQSEVNQFKGKKVATGKAAPRIGARRADSNVSAGRSDIKKAIAEGKMSIADALR